MLRHADPAKLLIDVTGTVLSAAFMYRRRPWVSLLVLFGSSALGSRVAASADLDALAATPRGRWMLGQAAPINLMLRSAGFAAVMYGLHRHQFLPGLAGVVLIVLGRVAGVAAGKTGNGPRDPGPAG